MGDAISSAAPADARPRGGTRTRWRVGVLLAGLVALALVLLLGLVVGARPIPPHAALDALFHDTGAPDQLVVRGLRLPRTLIGLTAGVGLGLAGALMQALTRNPLADPGLLGINSGASAAIVVGIGFFGMSSPGEYVWFSLVGAVAVAAVVHLLGTRGPGASDPVRLALAGVAVSAACLAFVQAMLLLHPTVFDAFRFWRVGSLAGRNMQVFSALLPFFAAGALLAFGIARPLNALGLGEEIGRSVGVRLGWTRLLAATSVALLCGAATAAAGPIWFVGLAVPHIARLITGPDQRWVLAHSAVLAPVLLVGADVLGRVVARPGELEVGIVTAFLGAPVLIALARKKRVVTP